MRLFLVDDHPVVRAGLVALLGGEDDIEVVGEASGADEALSGIAERRPDVVLMDLQLGDGVDGSRPPGGSGRCPRRRRSWS